MSAENNKRIKKNPSMQRVKLLPCMLGKSSIFFSCLLIFFSKLMLSNNSFKNTTRVSNHLGKRSVQTFCQALSETKLFAKTISISKDFCCRAFKVTEASNLEINYFGFSKFSYYHYHFIESE